MLVPQATISRDTMSRREVVMKRVLLRSNRVRQRRMKMMIIAGTRNTWIVKLRDYNSRNEIIR